MHIKEDIIEQYIENRLEFDISNIRLKNIDYSISGSGLVKINPEGTFELKVYSRKKNPIPFDYFIDQYNKSNSSAGKLIQKGDYFKLSGKNKNNTHFTCKQISLNSSNENISHGSLRNLFEISSPDARQRKYKNAEIIINSNISIPINSGQRTEKEYPDGNKFSNLSRNSFLVDTIDTKILMYNLKNYFIINISANDEIIDYRFIDNVINSLSFILGKFLKWNIVKFYSKDAYKYSYSANLTEKKGANLSKAPFDFLVFMEKSDHNAKLFLNYFEFLNKDKKRILYKITVRNLLAGYSYLNVFSLTLSANIEELLKVYFKKFSNYKRLKTKDIDDAIEKIKTISLNGSLHNRLIGFLRSIKSNIHVKDIFKGLIHEGYLDKDLFNDWTKLRNASTHGDATDNFDTQKHLDLIYKNLVLYHIIVFLLIGYTGLYSNYQLYGHPSNSFDIKL